jgi:hypothetical protein
MATTSIHPKSTARVEISPQCTHTPVIISIQSLPLSCPAEAATTAGIDDKQEQQHERKIAVL